MQSGELKQKSRKDTTVITSVSVSPEFHELVEKYRLSPSEVYRKGVAVCLAEIGVTKYATSWNKTRLERADEFLRQFRESKIREEFLREELRKLRELLETLNNF